MKKIQWLVAVILIAGIAYLYQSRPTNVATVPFLHPKDVDKVEQSQEEAPMPAEGHFPYVNRERIQKLEGQPSYKGLSSYKVNYRAERLAQKAAQENRQPASNKAPEKKDDDE